MKDSAREKLWSLSLETLSPADTTKGNTKTPTRKNKERKLLERALFLLLLLLLIVTQTTIHWHSTRRKDQEEKEEKEEELQPAQSRRVSSQALRITPAVSEVSTQPSAEHKDTRLSCLSTYLSGPTCLSRSV